jgi:PleD family two-component response regulator
MLLSDIGLPEMDGYELIQRIRQRSPPDLRLLNSSTACIWWAESHIRADGLLCCHETKRRTVLERTPTQATQNQP